MFLAITHTLGRIISWIAQSAMPLGRPGARIAHWMFSYAIRLAPKLPEPRGWRYLLEATFGRRQGDEQRALELLRKAHDVLPEDNIIAVNLGIQLAMSGHYQQSISTLQRAMKGKQDAKSEPQAWMALAWSYLRSDRAARAIKACDRAQDAGIDTTELQIVRILAAGCEGGAIDSDKLAPLITRRGRMVPMLLQFAEYLVRNEANDMAIQTVMSLPGELRNRAWLLIGRSSLNSDDLSTAAWAAKRHQSSQPDSAAGYTLRAEISLQSGEYDAARSHAENAISKEPDAPDALEQMVRVCVVRGEHDRALEHAVRAMDHKSNDALSAAIVAFDLLKQDEVIAARKSFVQQKSGEELGCSYGHTAQACIAVEMGGYEEGIELAEQAIDYLQELPDWASGHGAAAYIRSALSDLLTRIIEESARDETAGHATELVETLQQLPRRRENDRPNG